MRKPFSSIAIGFILLTTVVLPSLVLMIFHTSSVAVGILLVSVLYIILFAVLSAIWPQSQSLGAGSHLSITVMGVIMIHSTISFLINDIFDFGRFLQSYLFLIIYIMGAFSFTLLVQRVPKFQTDFVVKLVFYVLFLSSIAGILDFSPFSSDQNKPVFFFFEPSQFALGFLPFLLYMVIVSNPRVKLLLLLLGYVIALLLENMTLTVGITIIVGLMIPLRRVLFLAPIVIILIFFTATNLEYYSSRVDISNDSPNLSTLVYLSGWERAYLNFEETSGLGVGFQQFGIIGSRGEKMRSVEMLAGVDLNLFDGGATASKYMAELGLLGLLMLLSYLVYFAKSARWLREISMHGVGSRECTKVFFLSCFVMYCIDFFIRGTGYFSSSGFFFVASLLWMAAGGQSDKE